MLPKSLLFIFVFCLFTSHSIYAADYAFTSGEKHWRVTLSQRALNQLGYKTDRADGVFTPATQNALESFQKKYKLPVTKNIDKQTYTKLMELQKSLTPTASSTAAAKASAEVKPAVSSVNRPSPAVIATAKAPASIPAKPKSKPTTSTNTKSSKNPKPLPNHLADKVVSTASKYQGAPYKFGGTTHRGFDCSGYTQVVFKQHGVTLPRTSDMQYKLGKPISKKELRKGDLVFFSTYEPGPSHVGIYDGNGKFWNATTSRGVMASPLNDPHYWGPRYLGARRIIL